MSRKTKKQEAEYSLHVLSNDPQSWKYDLLQMLYTGAFKNQLGYMDAMNSESGTVERLLVGLEPKEDGNVAAYPLAKFLDQEELSKYLAPDGKGAFGV